MFTSDTLADKASAILFGKMERRLEALLAERGASDPGIDPMTENSVVRARQCWNS
jgi:hypothetical protein